MAGFKDLDIGKVFNVTYVRPDVSFNRGLEAFRDLLQKETVVRLFVDGTPGMGHQVASIRVLRTLVDDPNGPYRGFGFNHGKSVEICYRPWNGHPDPREKIRSLSPDVDWNASSPTLNGATLRLRRYPLSSSQRQEKRFGFAGGADSLDQNDDDDRLRSSLNVRYFLRLQPFLWVQPHQVQRKNAAPLELRLCAHLGSASFIWRAYFIPPQDMTEADWQSYTAGADEAIKRKATVLKWLTAPERGNDFDLCVIYSFHTSDPVVVTSGPSEVLDSLLNVLAAVRVAQKQRKKPAIVINLDNLQFADDFGEGEGYQVYPSFRYIWSVLRGNLTRMESFQTGFQLRRDLEAQARRLNAQSPRKKELRAVALRARRRRRFFDDLVAPKTGGITEHLRFEQDLELRGLLSITNSWLKNRSDRVLFLQVGRVPPDIFAYVFQKSTLPTAFEGLNTANLALNIGNGYLNILRPEQRGAYVNYPSVLLGRRSETAARKFSNAASLVNSSLHEWPAGAKDSAPERLGNFIAEYTKQRDSRLGGELSRYMKRVKDFYSKPRNDKLRMGLNYLGFVQAGRLPSAGLGAEPNDLDRIFAELDKQITPDKELTLLPGLLAEFQTIGSFYQELLGGDAATFLVRDARVEKTPTAEGETETVVLNGKTDAFVGGMSAVITFSLMEGHVRALARYTCREDRWTPDGLPWISLSDPFLEFDVVQGGLPMVGAVGGTVTLGGKVVTLNIALPIAEDRWLLRATPETNDIGLSEAYDFFAGVNLLSVLPREIATLGGLHLTAIEGVFDSSPESRGLEYLMAEAETSTEFQLLDNLKLAKIGLQIVVESPTASPSLSGVITGEFKIGEAVVLVSASAPELRFSGALTSGEIKFVDLISLFKPGVESPKLEFLPTITGFGFSYDHTSKDWEVGCNLTMPEPWALDVDGVRLVQLESLGFLATNYSTSLHGSVTILPNAPKVKLQLDLSAGYDRDTKAWQFAARQTGGRLPLGELAKVCLKWQGAPKIDITGLGLTFNPTNKAYTFTAETAEDFDIPFLGLKVGASVRLDSDGAESRSGKIAARATWRSIELDVTYAFENQKQLWKIAWEGKTAEYLNDVVRIRLSGVTVGDLVCKFVNWATAGKRFGLTEPWNVLDKINLDGLEASFNFKTKAVSVTLPNLNLNLGFLQIKDLILTYSKKNEGDRGRVEISLTGSFPWKTDGKTEELKWDAADPESAPAPPGSGKSFLDLRLLALGQHVAIRGAERFSSINEAIEAMRALPAPSDENVPIGPDPEEGQPYFDADSSWLIAADFGLLQDAKSKSGHAVQMSLVLNDPALYGIRMALAGDAAKIFSGLEFEIMYRRISDTIGVYQTEVTLPDAMRHLNLGAYAVTLPVVGLQIYTNGDYFVDFGFPWNGNFARSFTVEGVVPPGIPVVGSGGFYFGKLSAETSEQLPAATAPGRFNPVIVFGFGLQVGFGRSLDKGPLKASFSLTLLGILEGVIARWNAAETMTDNPPDQLQGDYYFKLNGTVGIIGKLRGAIDFAVVKASVYVEVKVIAQICVESYRDIPVTVLASVDIRVSLQLNLGIFKITINFSFSAQIKETFVIHNPEANALPPWNRSGQNRLQESRGWNKLTVARRGYRSCAPANLKWDNYRFGSARIDLVGHLVPMLTVRYIEGKPETCYVAALFLDTVAEGGDAQDESSSTSFQKLCEEILRWTLAAARDGKIQRTKLDKSPVSKDDLDAVILALGNHDQGVPISAAAAAKFMGMCFSLNLSVPPDKKAATDRDQPKNLAAFPMVPELHLKVAAAEDLDYSFNDFTTLSETYVADLRARFDSLAEQVEEELERNAAPRNVVPPANARESMASFCFGDYFLLLARQMAQAARDAIGNFQYPITPGQSIFDIVGEVNRWSPKDKSKDYPEFSPEELFRANADHPLSAGKLIHLDNLTYQVAEGDTLSGIVERYRPPTGKGFEAEDLAKKNAQSSEDILVAGTEIKIGETDTYLVKSGDTLQIIADHLSNGDVARLIKEFKLDSFPGLLKPLAVLELPNFVHQTVATDTLASIAARYHIKVDHLTQRDAGVQRQRQAPLARRSRRSGTLPRGAPSASETNLSIQDLFASSDEDLRYLRVTHRERFTVEALLKQIRRSNGSMQLSGMASRYMLHGLRLPTDGITPKDEKTRLRPVMGLYELTGQQFPIRGPVKDFSFTLSKVQKKPGWIKFADDLATTELTFAVGIEEVKRIGAVEQAAASGIEPGLTQLGALDAATATPATFPLRSTMRWQCAPAADFELSYGQAPKTHDELRMWWLPEGIYASGGSGVTSAAAPRLSVQIASYDDAKSETTAAESKAFEYATLVDFTVKKLVPSIQSATTRATYELVGAGDQGIIRLERLLRAEASPLSGTILYQDPSAAEDSSPRALESSAAAVTTFISQVNLTTYTQPRAVAGAAGTGASLDWRDFAQRLWRGSITRSGGFYLYYSDSEDQGLPERIFDDRGEARLWVLLRYPKPTEADRQMRPSAYMNCVITGDAIDVKEESSSAVFLEAAPTPKEVEVKVGESLQSIGDEHFMSPIDVAMENSDRRLVIGYPITIDGGTYMVGSPGAAAGSRLLDIADYFNTSVEAIRKANPERTDWPEQLSPGDSIRLPTLRTTVDRGIVIGGKTNQSGDTMAQIADYHGCKVADIAHANADASGLIAAGQKMSLSGGPSLRAANSAAGTVAIGATRNLPKEPDLKKPEEVAKYYLQQTFSMLRYQVSGNLDFTPSIEGLPMGPVREDPYWLYRASIPYARLPSPGADAPAENPYAHIGDLLQVEYGWQDIFGNAGPTPPAPPNKLPVRLGYTDDLIGLSAWPGVASTYHVRKNSEATPELAVVLHFDASRYEQAEDKLQKLSGHADDRVPAWQRNAQLDLKVFTRLCHQLEAGNEITQRVKFSLETSLLAQGSVEFSTEQSEVLYGWVRNIRDYLQGRARGQKKRFDAGSLGSLEICFTVGAKDQAGLNPAQIFALTVALRLRRPEVAVHPTLRDNRAIFDLRSEINPLVPADDPAQPRFRAKNQSLDSLGRFAQAFETALDQAEPGVSFKIASGVPRGSLSDGESRTTLWVVRLSDAGNGIGYRLFNAAAPIIFAVRPLATKPVAVDGQDYDMDALCRGFTRALDELLSPEYAVPARALQVNALEPLLGAKEELATAFSRLVAPVFKSVEPIKPEEKSAAEELLRQRLLVRLSNLYDSAALVQFSTEVKSHFDGDGAPRLYGKPEPKSASNQTPEVSFSSAKLSLAGGATPSLLTFAAEIADQTSGLKESYLPLELEFKATHIEHEIDEGMDGYQPSSWLAFVTPPEPLIQDLGGFNLPRLLRLGPTPPNLKHQAVDFGPRLSPTSLASLLNWDYQFSYSQSYHEPQDKTKFEVTFGPAPEQWLDDEPNPLFNALVKFAAAYPGLLQTLNNAIAKGEGEQEAFAAITALIDEVAVAARTVLIDTAVPTLSELANDAQKYAFTIDQKPIDLDQRAGAVLFLGIVGKPPEGVGEPSVQIEGYVTEPVVEEEYDFGFVFHHGDGETRNYLSAEAGRSIPERTVTLPGLNVLARENAALSAWVVRNENTIDPVRKTSPEFIYESARSEPGFRVYPMIEIEDEIRIHEIGGTARRSLAQHLGTFWSALFAESSATQCILQLECSYGYRLDGNSILPAIRVPVLFRPPAPFQLPTQNGQGTMIPAAVENLAKAMDDWAAQKQPSQTQAELSLDITIFTSSGEQTPLLQLHNAVLAVSSLEPGW